MSKEKSIEAAEIFTILSETINGANFDDLCDATRMIVHSAGYCKQREGEWIDLPDYGNGWFQNGRRIFPKSCSVCGGVISYGPYKFCPNCGAKMKGGVTAESAIKAVQEAARELKDTPPDDLLGIGSTMQF